jgi:hypothetical protein
MKSRLLACAVLALSVAALPLLFHAQMLSTPRISKQPFQHDNLNTSN